MRRKNSEFKYATGSGSQTPIVPNLQFLFNLSLTEPGQWYKFKKDAPQCVHDTVDQLHSIGLLTVKEGKLKKGHENQRKDSKFCVSPLLSAFLTGTSD